MSSHPKPCMLAPVRVSAPALEPITLAEAKAHCRVDHDDDNTLIEFLIRAATAKLDGYNGDLGQALITQTWRVSFDRFPGERRLSLPIGPVQSVSVAYYDSDNAEQSLVASNFGVHEDELGPFLWLDEAQSAWPGTKDRRDAVQVTIVAGYGPTGSPSDASDVPEPIRQAMLLLLGHWYEHREQVVIGVTPATVPFGYDALITNFRRPAFI